jgi:hypothetical protein
LAVDACRAVIAMQATTVELVILNRSLRSVLSARGGRKTAKEAGQRKIVAD